MRPRSQIAAPRFSLPLAVAGLLLAACGGGSGNLAVVGSSPSSIGVGPQRIVLAEVDPETSAFVGGPDEQTTVEFTGPSGDTQEVDARWVWSIPNVRGFLIAHPDFAAPGTWTISIESPRGPSEETMFTVNGEIPLPEIGEQAPASETPTLPRSPLEAITSDPDPDPSFYENSVADVVTNGTPALIVFATPAFCQTAVCGPTMDIVKEVSAERPDLDVVHVEVFENIDSEGEGALVEAPAVVEWGLPSEPWVFVTDSDGEVVARFEGAVSAAEILDAIDSVD